MKQAKEWLNEVGETVMLSAFAGASPPGIEVERLVERIQMDALGLSSTLVVYCMRCEFKADANDHHIVGRAAFAAMVCSNCKEVRPAAVFALVNAVSASQEAIAYGKDPYDDCS